MTAHRPAAPAPIDHRAVGILGLLTIVSYGSWYYAFGVLFDPIREDTGWGESAMATSFAAGIVANGLAGVAAGRLLDRVGSRVVLLIGGVVGSGGLVAASLAPSIGWFVLGSMVAMGALGGFGFYHVTMTCVVRLNPERSARAIAVLTIWGAFASAIYLPATAALVDRLGWRPTVRILAAVALATFLLAAFAVASVRSDEQTDRLPIRQVFGSTMSRPDRRAFTGAIALGWIAMSIILVYQVPVMTAVGLPLATAATMAGLRGFAQTAGRLPLGRMVERLGSARSVAVAMTAIGLGGLVLGVSGQIIPALGFALLAGFGIGAMSPLQGIVVEELFDRDHLGAMMGTYSLIGMGGGAIGPATAGILAEWTGSRRSVTVLIALCGFAAALLALRIRAEPEAAPAAGRIDGGVGGRLDDRVDGGVDDGAGGPADDEANETR